MEAGLTEQQAKIKAFESEKIQKKVENKKIKKAIFVQDKLINIVV